MPFIWTLVIYEVIKCNASQQAGDPNDLKTEYV